MGFELCARHQLSPLVALSQCKYIQSRGIDALDGERSGLFYELARIVRTLGPRIVVLENVSALLARGMGDVLGGLAALGYDAEWEGLPAFAFGAPQRRDRIFVVAYANQVGRSGRTQRDIFATARLEAPRRGHTDGLDLAETGPWSSLPDVLRVDYGLPGLVDRLGACGNAVVPQVSEWIGHRIILWDSMTVREGDEHLEDQWPTNARTRA